MCETKFKKYSVVEVSQGKKYWVKRMFVTTFMSNGSVYYVVKSDGLYTHTYKYCRYIRPDLDMDTPVWIKFCVPGKWKRRHFAGWDDSNNMLVYTNGGTSHSRTRSQFMKVFEFSLTDPNKSEE